MAEDKAIQGVENKELVGVDAVSASFQADDELRRIGKGLTQWHLLTTKMVSEYAGPKQILEACKPGLDDGSITEAWVRQCSATLSRGKQQQQLVDRWRDIAWQRRRDIPIVNPSMRAAIRNQLAARNLDKDPELVRKLLVDADNAYSEEVQDDRQSGVTINIGQFQGLQGLSGGPDGPVGDGLIVLEATPGVALPEFGADTYGQPADEMVDIEVIDDSLADSEAESGSEVDEDENGDSQVNTD